MSGVRVLIVESEPVTSLEVEELLLESGYSISAVVDTGEKAIEDMERYPPDIVLMGIRLKGTMDGIEAAGIIRSRIDTPIVFLTSCIDENRLSQSGLTRSFRYLVKPFRQKELEATLSMVLGTRADSSGLIPL